LERINYWALGITIFIALTCARLISDLIEWKVAAEYLQYVTQEMQKKADAEAKINAQRQDAEAKNKAARDAEIVRQQENYQAEQQRIAIANRIKAESAVEAQKKRMETCQFWINEFQKTKSETDKNHRNNSCRDAAIIFN